MSTEPETYDLPAFSEGHRVSVVFNDETYGILKGMSDRHLTTMTHILHVAVLRLAESEEM